jgi:hypothetical protein
MLKDALLWKYQRQWLPPRLEGMDRSFFKENHPGFGKETSLGTAAAEVIHANITDC